MLARHTKAEVEETKTKIVSTKGKPNTINSLCNVTTGYRRRTSERKSSRLVLESWPKTPWLTKPSKSKTKQGQGSVITKPKDWWNRLKNVADLFLWLIKLYHFISQMLQYITIYSTLSRSATKWGDVSAIFTLCGTCSCSSLCSWPFFTSFSSTTRVDVYVRLVSSLLTTVYINHNAVYYPSSTS